VVKDVRSRGIQLIGYTWFPLCTMIDWNYRYGTGPAKRHRIELGFYILDGEGGRSRWRSTPLVEHLQRHIRNTSEAVGALAIP
jgi:beta-glucosidase